VYSLGLCGWELLSGRRDPKLTAIVLRAMARQPDKRFQSARELCVALEAWLAQSGETPELAATMRRLFGADERERERRAELPTEPTAVSHPRPRRIRVRWPFRLAAVAAAALVLGLALRWPSPPATPAPTAHTFRPARTLPRPPARRPHDRVGRKRGNMHAGG
jgi:hypothetical protein